jgi:hypothetical protein
MFLGGIPAWLIAMAGWVFNPHLSETRAKPVLAGPWQHGWKSLAI